MDFNLAALKLFSTQLSSARPTHDSSQSHLLLGPILFQRAWIQGVVISLPSTTAGGGDGGRFVVDDGTGVVELLVANDVLNRGWKLGDYVMVVGGCRISKDEIPSIRVNYVIDMFVIREMIGGPKLRPKTKWHHLDVCKISGSLSTAIKMMPLGFRPKIRPKFRFHYHFSCDND